MGTGECPAAFGFAPFDEGTPVGGGRRDRGAEGRRVGELWGVEPGLRGAEHFGYGGFCRGVGRFVGWKAGSPAVERLFERAGGLARALAAAGAGDTEGRVRGATE